MLNWIHVNSSRRKLLLINACTFVLYIVNRFCHPNLNSNLSISIWSLICIYILCAYSKIEWMGAYGTHLVSLNFHMPSALFTFDVKSSFRKEIVSFYNFTHWKLFNMKVEYPVGFTIGTGPILKPICLCLDVDCLLDQCFRIYVWRELLSNFNQNRIAMQFLVRK